MSYLASPLFSNPSIVVRQAQVEQPVPVPFVRRHLKINRPTAEVLFHVHFVETHSVQGWWEFLEINEQGEEQETGEPPADNRINNDTSTLSYASTYCPPIKTVAKVVR